METNVVLDVTKKLRDMYVLSRLNYFYRQYSTICEIKYLKEFALLETLNEYDPKFIILHVLTIHMRSALRISLQPNRLQNLVFMCHEEGKNVRKFEFSNNMTFNNDIVSLCFLYHVTHNRGYDKCETVQNLMSLMLNKYGICLERNDTEPTKQQNEITLSDVAESFPSVTWDMSRNLACWMKLFSVFSDFIVPKLIFLPDILSLLPHLNGHPPLVIILAAKLTLNKFYGEKYDEIPLRTVYTNILNVYNRNRFPESLKLYLCEKWKIVIFENGLHKYSSYFAAYNRRAKKLITEIKSDDPDLTIVEFLL